MIRRLTSLVAATITLVTALRVLSSDCETISFERAGPRGSSAASCASGAEGIPTAVAGIGLLLIAIALAAVAAWPAARQPTLSASTPARAHGEPRMAHRKSDSSARLHDTSDDGFRTAPALLADAAKFARELGLPDSQRHAAQQAIDRSSTPGATQPLAWCFSDSPEGLLVAYSAKDVTRFIGARNWTGVFRGEADAYGAAPDGTIRIIELAGRRFEGLRPAHAANKLTQVLRLRESNHLTELCGRPENSHWTQQDEATEEEPAMDSPVAQGTRSIADRIAHLNELHSQGLITAEQRDDRIRTILEEV